MKLILIRGLPGTGKSTFARNLEMLGYNHFEADQFFMVDGKYVYDKRKVSDAHEWCQKQCKEHLLLGKSVVVSNTFTRIFEMQPYFDMAEELNIKVHVCEMSTVYKNTHSVPETTIARMQERWESLQKLVDTGEISWNASR